MCNVFNALGKSLIFIDDTDRISNTAVFLSTFKMEGNVSIWQKIDMQFFSHLISQTLPLPTDLWGSVGLR